MNKYSEEFLSECAETLLEADEIQGNKELMKELEPVLKEKGKRLLTMGSSLKDLWKKGLQKAVEQENMRLEEDEEDEDKMSERMISEKRANIQGKA